MDPEDQWLEWIRHPLEQQEDRWDHWLAVLETAPLTIMPGQAWEEASAVVPVPMVVLMVPEEAV